MAIGEVCKKQPRLPLLFLKANREEFLREILKWETFKARKDTDILTKICF